MKHYLHVIAALTAASAIAQANASVANLPYHGLNYELGYEWQSDKTQLLNLSLNGLGLDGLSVEALAMYDSLNNDTSPGIGIRYNQPMLFDRFSLSAATRHYWTSSDDVSPNGQIMLGGRYQTPINDRHGLEWGIGGYYNIIDRNAQTGASVEHDKAGAFLSVSWRYQPSAPVEPDDSFVTEPVTHTEEVLPVVATPEQATEPALLGSVSFVENGSTIINSRIPETASKTRHNVNFIAHYSCSGTDIYNNWLSLRRIEKAKNQLLDSGFSFSREGYTIAKDCVPVSDIRVDAWESPAESATAV